MQDEKISLAIKSRDEQTMAYVIRKYSKLLWTIASAVLINSASVQDIEECVADVFIDLLGMMIRQEEPKEVAVEEGEIVMKGECIGSLGKTGMATGPNLSFAVYEAGEAVNPLKE